MSAKTTQRNATRASSEERREQVLEAAVKEFAASGYHAASTSAIAKRAGISQPYIYALFPNKRELFLATHRRVTLRILEAFAEAARGKDGTRRSSRRWERPTCSCSTIATRSSFQMQAHAAAGDPELREPIREDFMRRDPAGPAASAARREEQVLGFMATGMFLNVAAALDLPEEYCPRGEA